MGFSTSKDLWLAIQELFGVQSRAEIDYLKRIFQQTRKGSTSMMEYLGTMKKYSDSLALAGSPVLARDLISQVLSGLDEEYNPVAVLLQSGPNVSWAEMQAELMSYEKRLEYQLSLKSGVSITSSTPPSVNMAHKKPPFGQGQNQRNQYDGQRGGRNRGQGRWNNHSNGRPTCQLCGKIGHSAAICFFRFNKEVNNPSQSREYQSNGSGNRSSVHPNALLAHNMVASPETVIDPNWYADSGASNHVTSNPNFQSAKTEYTGNESVFVGDGSQLNISHTGYSFIPSTGGNLKLENVLCVPHIAKNLVRISKLARDNNVFVEFHADFCVVKDKMSGTELLRGTLKDGLYQIDSPGLVVNNGTFQSKGCSPTAAVLSNSPSFFGLSRVNAVVNVIVTKSLLHRRLGHPSLKVLDQILKNCTLNFPINEKLNFCEACQFGKMHA